MHHWLKLEEKKCDRARELCKMNGGSVAPTSGQDPPGCSCLKCVFGADVQRVGGNLRRPTVEADTSTGADAVVLPPQPPEVRPHVRQQHLLPRWRQPRLATFWSSDCLRPYMPILMLRSVVCYCAGCWIFVRKKSPLEATRNE